MVSPRPFHKSLLCPAFVLALVCSVIPSFCLAQISEPSTSTSTSSGATLAAAGRILNQATFGPTISDYYLVTNIGVAAYVKQQLGIAPYLMPTVIPAADYSPAKGDCDGWNCDPEAWWWHDVLF